MNLELFDVHVIRPFSFLGLTGDFWAVTYWTIIYTWVGMFMLFSAALIGRRFMNSERGLIYASFERMILVFIDLCTDSFKAFNFDYFAFIVTLFFFTLFSCLVGLIPFLDEATKDLNTTLAIGTISFMYVQIQKIKVHGFGGFCKEFIEPFALLAPVNIIGELAKICSMSFRLFGNILGGGVIYLILLEFIGTVKHIFLGYVAIVLLLALLFFYLKKHIFGTGMYKILNVLIGIMFLLTWIQIFFGIFEGLIQAFVITMLTTTYLAIAVHTEDEHDNHQELTTGAEC
jgi:F-type H+-transporting ATPase subunit a